MTQDLNQENKRKKTVIVAIIAVVVIALIAGVYISGSSGRKLKKQLDLGYKFLTEQEYEQAIAIFKKAIEIDPMSVDAYLGLADAYVGKGDFETAKSTLEDAIKFFEENGQDTTVLKNKIEEIDRIEGERRAKEEEERLAALPFVEIQPILDAASDVWGKNWYEWTVEDFQANFNMSLKGNSLCKNDSSFHYESYLNPLGGQNCLSENTHVGDFCLETIVVSIYDTGHKQLRYYVQEQPYEGHEELKRGLYTFAKENGISDPKTFATYLGLSEHDYGEEPLAIRTEYGTATMSLENNGFIQSLDITLDDKDTNPVVQSIAFQVNSGTDDLEGEKFFCIWKQ